MTPRSHPLVSKQISVRLVADLGRQIGFLQPDQERALSIAIVAAFDLE